MIHAAIDPQVLDRIAEADRTVRGILWDITGLNGPGLAAGWPAFIAAASDTLNRLPNRDLATRTLIPRTQTDIPAVSAAPDARLHAATNALTGALAVLRATGCAPPQTTIPQRGVEEARLSLARIVHNATHATVRGLREHADRVKRHGWSGQWTGQPIPIRSGIARATADQLEQFEARVCNYLMARTAGAAAAIERPGPPGARATAQGPAQQGVRATVEGPAPGTVQLAQALARWEVCVARALNGPPPGGAVLVDVAYSQAAIVTNAMVLFEAAACTGAIDARDLASTVQPGLHRLRSEWEAVADTWRHLTVAGDRAATFSAEVRQLHTSLRALTTDGPTWADPATIAARVDLPRAAGLIRDSLSTSAAVTARYTELPDELAGAGTVSYPAQRLAALRHPPVDIRLADVANHRIVTVRPGEVDPMVTVAIGLDAQLMASLRALETLNIPRITAAPPPAADDRLDRATRRAEAHHRLLSPTTPTPAPTR